MQKIFYHPASNKHIVDNSGRKTLAEIEENFNVTGVQESMLENGEGYRIENGAIVKYSIVEEETLKRVNEKQKAIQAFNRIRAKLSLSVADAKELLIDMKTVTGFLEELDQ